MAGGNDLRTGLQPTHAVPIFTLFEHHLVRAFRHPGVNRDARGAFFVVRVIGPVDNFLAARALRLGARKSAAIVRSRPSFP